MRAALVPPRQARALFCIIQMSRRDVFLECRLSSRKKSLRGDLSFQFAGAAGVVAILAVFYYESCAQSAAAGKSPILHLPDNADEVEFEEEIAAG